MPRRPDDDDGAAQSSGTVRWYLGFAFLRAMQLRRLLPATAMVAPPSASPSSPDDVGGDDDDDDASATKTLSPGADWMRVSA